jgi:hypothetical protein
MRQLDTMKTLDRTPTSLDVDPALLACGAKLEKLLRATLAGEPFRAFPGWRKAVITDDLLVNNKVPECYFLAPFPTPLARPSPTPRSSVMSHLLGGSRDCPRHHARCTG